MLEKLKSEFPTLVISHILWHTAKSAKTFKIVHTYTYPIQSLIYIRGWEFAHQFFEQTAHFLGSKEQKSDSLVKRGESNRSRCSLPWATWANSSWSLFYKNVKNRRKIRFLSELLIFLEQFARITSKSLTLLFFKEIESNLLTVTLFKRAMIAICSLTLFFKLGRDRFAHGRSFFKERRERSLTVALFKRLKRAKKQRLNERILNPDMYICICTRVE